MVLGTRLSICRSIMSLSKITHQMWGVILLGTVGAVNKIWKREGRQYRKGGGRGGGEISLPTKTI